MAITFFGWLGAILQLSWQAGATMPLLTIFSLIAGRRGNGQFYIGTAVKLARFGIALAILGVIYFPYDYFLQILIMKNGAMNIWEPFFTTPGRPWMSSLIAQFGGAIFMAVGYASFFFITKRPEKYALSLVKRPVYLFLAAALFFFSTFFLINWPFADLPQGLPFDRAIFAVMRNAANRFFMAFTPAAGMALLVLYKSAAGKMADTAPVITAARWLSFWGCAGLIPFVGQAWAILIGLGFRGNLASYFPGGYGWHIGGIALLTISMILWFLQAVLKKNLYLVVVSAFTLYIIQVSLPFARQLV